MKKYKNFLFLSTLTMLLGILDIICVFFWSFGESQNRLIGAIGLLILFFWACGSIVLFIRRGKQNRILSKLLIAGNVISLCVLFVFCCLFVLAIHYDDTGDFSITTSLFDNKNVMVIVPHQDDDINLVGGLIEQYTQSDSQVSVVFTTNGDGNISAEERAAEVVSVLTPLGVKKENIYYLGFGDQWQSQTVDGVAIPHIYNSLDSDTIWTSVHGATATYGTESIPCYLELPYTRSNYLYSLESIIQDVMPDTIFAVDFDTHSDHRATDLFFEEALCNILKNHPDYHPLVYKGFCYGTAWEAIPDFHDNLNLLSTKKPDTSVWDITSFGYTWEDRVRFPMSAANLNIVLVHNSVFQSFNDYSSQFAYLQAKHVLNGDKVFWERRTDSLLYGAEIHVGGEPTSLLNDFKLKDFTNLFAVPETSSGVSFLNSKTVQVMLEDAVTANCIYLYDNPDKTQNILSGYISFSDGSKIEFGELHQNGSATVIPFPEKPIEWFEIVPTKVEGDKAGLSEVELYLDAKVDSNDTYFMAVDSGDNFVYDYIIPDGNSAFFKLYRFPHAQQVTKDDVTIVFDSEEAGNSCNWEGDTLTVTCAKGSHCTVTVSTEDISTTFGVSNPTAVTRAYLSALQNMGKVALDTKLFFFRFYLFFYRMLS